LFVEFSVEKWSVRTTSSATKYAILCYTHIDFSSVNLIRDQPIAMSYVSLRHNPRPHNVTNRGSMLKYIFKKNFKMF